MVRFHLFGLVAVALAIQAPPSRSRSKAPQRSDPWTQDVETRPTKSNKPPDSYYREGTCASLRAEFVGDDYSFQCQCGGQDWWKKYQKCLDAHRNSWLKHDISKDKANRCSSCNAVYDTWIKGDYEIPPREPFRICQAWRAGVS
ncbi:BQ5605_C017g08566 [Microbotryum silenes-dioicae]|uniref:BQ5605_C017g08566 protein n=1 Tax=Microbotryum silenes-dioicae TaxID=796604 RepID=A0A2X0LZ28_9BASI|nr:BQ5605_C017g08566 [Microbotryum silenes-dioicae]